MKREELIEILKNALPYIEGAYECAFRDDEWNKEVAQRVKDAIEAAEADRIY